MVSDTEKKLKNDHDAKRDKRKKNNVIQTFVAI